MTKPQGWRKSNQQESRTPEMKEDNSKHRWKTEKAQLSSPFCVKTIRARGTIRVIPNFHGSRGNFWYSFSKTPPCVKTIRAGGTIRVISNFHGSSGNFWPLAATARRTDTDRGWKRRKTKGGLTHGRPWTEIAVAVVKGGEGGAELGSDFGDLNLGRWG
ncbi:hypothetical protein GQ457_11G029560 [Hibiscus cannabinus]